jgi:hypothetical protein
VAQHDDDLYLINNNQSMKLTLRIADTYASINLEGQTYNPDILDDATTRLTKLFATGLAIATTNGYQFFIPDIDDDDDDDA